MATRIPFQTMDERLRGLKLSHQERRTILGSLYANETYERMVEKNGQSRLQVCRVFKSKRRRGRGHPDLAPVIEYVNKLARDNKAGWQLTLQEGMVQ